MTPAIYLQMSFDASRSSPLDLLYGLTTLPARKPISSLPASLPVSTRALIFSRWA